MFDIQFLDKNNERKYCWQTSWGLSIRSIGVMVMVHGDNKGLVLPPKLAKVQVVIVPILFKGTEEVVANKAKELEEVLLKAGIRVKVDDRENHTPGWKYNYWELKGVPLRIEIGPKDLGKGEVRAVIRHNGEKFQMKWDGLAEKVINFLDLLCKVLKVNEVLETIQKDMFVKAKEKRDSKLKTASNWETFMKYLNEGCMVLTPW